MSATAEKKVINATADGNNTVIAGVAGARIKVLSYLVTVTAAAAALIFKSGAGGTEHARFALPVNGGASWPGDGVHSVFDCDAGADFVVNNPTGVDTLGHIVYTIENV